MDPYDNGDAFNENKRSDLVSVLDGHGSYDFPFEEIYANEGDEASSMAELLANVADVLHEAFRGVAEASRTSPNTRSFENAGLRWDAEARAMRASGNPVLIAFIEKVAAWIAKHSDGKHTNQYTHLSPAYRTGKCITALVWLTNPDHFNGAALRSLVKEFGVSVFALSCLTSDASRHFGILNRTQDLFAKAKAAKGHKLRQAAAHPEAKLAA